MENTELLQQVLVAMQEQTEVLTKMVDTKIKESETRINIKIENEITKRLDALTDGYKLNHEKQYELERKMERLEKELDHIRNILAVAGLVG